MAMSETNGFNVLWDGNPKFDILGGKLSIIVNLFSYSNLNIGVSDILHL